MKRRGWEKIREHDSFEIVDKNLNPENHQWKHPFVVQINMNGECHFSLSLLLYCRCRPSVDTMARWKITCRKGDSRLCPWKWVNVKRAFSFLPSGYLGFLPAPWCVCVWFLSSSVLYVQEWRRETCRERKIIKFCDHEVYTSSVSIRISLLLLFVLLYTQRENLNLKASLHVFCIFRTAPNPPSSVVNFRPRYL